MLCSCGGFSPGKQKSFLLCRLDLNELKATRQAQHEPSHYFHISKSKRNLHIVERVQHPHRAVIRVSANFVGCQRLHCNPSITIFHLNHLDRVSLRQKILHHDIFHANLIMSICFVSVYLGLDSNGESPKLAVQFLANSASRGRKRRVSDYSPVLTTQDLPAHATCCESIVVLSFFSSCSCTRPCSSPAHMPACSSPDASLSPRD